MESIGKYIRDKSMPVFELAYQNFTGRILRQLIKYFNFLRYTERGHICAAICPDLIGGQLASVDENHTGLYSFAPGLVRHAIDGALTYIVCELHYDICDFARIYIFAAGDDHIIYAS